MNLAAIILAAGTGSRMKSSKPKVLHSIAGLPLLGHVLTVVEKMNICEIRVVVGYQSKQVENYLKDIKSSAISIHQKKQLGTGDAVRCTQDSLTSFEGNIIILCGDVPFVSKVTLNKMTAKISQGADIAILGFNSNNPANYGRIIKGRNHEVEKIVEEKDASLEQKKITLCNAGIFCGKKDTIFSLLKEVRNSNAQSEFYLTDIIEIAVRHGLKSALIECEATEVLGVNSRKDLADAEKVFQKSLREYFLDSGVTLIDPNTNYFSYDTIIDPDTAIHQNVIIGPSVKIGRDSEILPFTHLEGCTIGNGSRIGPFARIRPQTTLKENVKIGNFVEVKNSTFDWDSKANHLAYIGDANIGTQSNVGAGTIFCNYDGVSKHQTEIGEKTFIGSNSSLVAPLKIGANVLIGSGSIITKDVPKNSLAIGRQKQANKKGLGKKLMDKLKNIKNKQM